MNNNEVDRQYRVLNQMVSMHSMLRDRFIRLALILDIILLACSVVFCAVTFASDEVLSFFDVMAIGGRNMIGIIAILTFFASLLGLLMNWKRKTALHDDAARQLTVALEKFREYRLSDGTWGSSHVEELNRVYWEANHYIVTIPEKAFLGLKARHLRKIQISKILDTRPGLPIFVLKLYLVYRSIRDKQADAETESAETKG